MTRRAIAVAALLVVALTACTRGSGAAATSSPSQVYSAGPNETDVRSLLGSNDWWESIPTFGVRPLGLPMTSESVRFTITKRFFHVGTSEFFIAEYVVYNSTSDATTEMTNISNSFPNSPTTPRAGDQSIYAGEKQPTNSALYSNLAFVRVGQAVISIEWDRNSGFADVNTLGKIATKLANKLKAGNAAKPPQVSDADARLLPPPGEYVTQVGIARLPVDAAAVGITDSDPQAIVDVFHQLGVTDFVFGDYALNSDLTMEVQALAFSFPTADNAKSWLDQTVGSANLDSNGVSSGYDSASGRYYAFFAVGTTGAMMFCSSISPQEAASRACEQPLGYELSAWSFNLSQG